MENYVVLQSGRPVTVLPERNKKRGVSFFGSITKRQQSKGGQGVKVNAERKTKRAHNAHYMPSVVYTQAPVIIYKDPEDGESKRRDVVLMQSDQQKSTPLAQSTLADSSAQNDALRSKCTEHELQQYCSSKNKSNVANTHKQRYVFKYSHCPQRNGSIHQRKAMTSYFIRFVCHWNGLSCGACSLQ